jgi:hypothetical protein
VLIERVSLKILTLPTSACYVDTVYIVLGIDYSGMETVMTDMKNFVVVAEHPPQLCPHSNAAARKIMQRASEIEATAKRLGIEIVFSGIPVPEHQTIMILRAPTFETVRTFTVETNFVQINTITIRQTESVDEFFAETKNSTPLF